MRRSVVSSRATSDGWVSMGPASRTLGVDPDTLRRWADTGRVRAYMTPGGHRRFSRADLDRVAAVRRPAEPPLAALGTTPDRVTRAYARAYRSGSPVAASRLPDDARVALRADGRRLVAVLLAYLDATGEPDRDRWAAEALGLIGAAGRRLADIGADVREVVAIFLQARRPLLEELGTLGRRRALEPSRLASLYERAAVLLDRLLLHLLETHAAALAAAIRR